MDKIINKRGFTDKLYWINFKCVWLFTIACFILNTLSGILGITDLSVIVYGIPSAFTELGIHTGFIVWKAKQENYRKYPKNSSGGDDYGNESTTAGYDRFDCSPFG